MSLTLVGGAESVHAKDAVEQLDVPINAPAKAARFYRPELDVVRFLAFAAVFLHHQLPRSTAQEHDGVVLGHLAPGAKVVLAGAANALGFGMSLFFTLSAYLICALLLREKERFGTATLLSSHVRRILLILASLLFWACHRLRRSCLRAKASTRPGALRRLRAYGRQLGVHGCGNTVRTAQSHDALVEYFGGRAVLLVLPLSNSKNTCLAGAYTFLAGRSLPFLT